MKIYNYHPETYEFITQSEADPSPLEQGKFIIPAFATDIKPPNTKANEVVIFRDGEWSIAPDYRGTTLYSIETNEPVTIVSIGQLPGGLAESPRPDVFYVWENGEWVLDRGLFIEHEARAVRNKRDSLLHANVDTMNIVRWSAMTEAQQHEWIAYRQALLDVPEQPGFPETIQWPEPPAEGGRL